MYSLKVSNIEVDEEEANHLADALVKSKVQEPDGPQGEADVLDFSAGNPRVEHVTGSIHLYRAMPSDMDARNAATMLPVGHLVFWGVELVFRVMCEQTHQLIRVLYRRAALSGCVCWPSPPTWACLTFASFLVGTCHTCGT